MICFLGTDRITQGVGTFTEKLFIVRLSHTAHLHDILNLLFRVLIKGISRTFLHRRSSDIKIVFCGLRLIHCLAYIHVLCFLHHLSACC